MKSTLEDIEFIKENYIIYQVFTEYVRYRKGHKNSKGESCPWVIVQHKTGKIISSHKSKAEAVKHLREIEYFKHKG